VAGTGEAERREGVVLRPGLFARLEHAERVTLVSAPAGSGKSYLLRSWARANNHLAQTAWVTVDRWEPTPQRFWASVVEALHATEAGARAVPSLTVAPELDEWMLVERLLLSLGAIDSTIWLVIDDLQELTSPEALAQLELFILRAPDSLRVVLATRREPSIALHRLRVAGELTELRGDDLRFSLEEARALFEEAHVQITDNALASLVDKTEGWAAGLRLGALCLIAHPDPDRFLADFSGSERTVADYLTAEVLDRQPEPVRQLLLRTSILGEVTGPLADHVTGATGGEAILQELERANAFVMAIDAPRTTFGTTRCLPSCCSRCCAPKRHRKRSRRSTCPRRIGTPITAWWSTPCGARSRSRTGISPRPRCSTTGSSTSRQKC
jgi:LuxR family maltose regulon positive regulatory protein